MATISSQDFFSKGPVKVVGNETQQKDSLEQPAQTFREKMGSVLETGIDYAKEAVQNPLEVAKGMVKGVPGLAAETTKLVEAPGKAIMKGIYGENAPQGLDYSAVEELTAPSNKAQQVGYYGSAFIPVERALPIAKEGIELATKAGKTGFDLVSEAVKGTKNLLTPEAEQIMQRVARVSKLKQANFEQRAGESIGEYLDKRGIYGDVEDITNQLYTRFSKSKEVADNALAEIQGTYRSQPLRTALNELEEKVTKTSSPGAPDADLTRVKELALKERTQGLTMSEVNEAKRLYERRVRLDHVKDNATDAITRSTNIDNALREWQFSEAEKAGLKNLPEINRETMLAKQLLNDLGQEYAGSAGNNSITLTDWIALSGGDLNSIAMFLTKQGLSSKTVQSTIAKYFSKNKDKLSVPVAEFKNKLGLPAKTEGQADISIETPINIGKSQTRADENLQTMISKQATQQAQQESIVPSTKNTTTKKKVNSGVLAGMAPIAITADTPIKDEKRGVEISNDDAEELLPIIYGEISNRDPKKQELEAKVILNTAINRVAEYAKRGVQKTLKDVLQEKNQYQAFRGKQYNAYKEGNLNNLDQEKKDNVHKIVSKLLRQIESGQFKDNTNGAFYYSHSGDKIYYDDTRPLFKKDKK